MKYFLVLAACLCLAGGYWFKSSTRASADAKAQSSISAVSLNNRLDQLCAKAISDAAKLPFDSLHIPRSLKSDKTLDATPSKSWTSGFYAGTLWQLYSFSQNQVLRQAAEQWQSPVEKEKRDSTTHDLGFKVYCSFGNGYLTTGNNTYKEICITAARTLSSRFNPKVGAIRSWDHHEHLWKFPVIIDNMMNLELLFEATRFTGDSSFYYIARSHALTTLKNHFRPDHSSYHVVDYDPLTGEVVQKNTHQGASDESAWSRGQAWGLYGFTMVYRYTGDTVFLEKARHIADFIFKNPNLPADYIPYWDYNAPNIPNEPRDVSAAAVAAAGLIEMSRYDTAHAKQYLAWADGILLSLETPTYQADAAPFFLQHSVGSIPGNFEIDAPIVYADYYYVEALLRRLDLLQ